MAVKSHLFKNLPGLQMISTYKPAWIRKDIVAAIVLSMLLVPQGMAYAELAGLPIITGLYTTIFCLIGYALLGPSRVLVLGPDSSLGPMIAIVIFSILGASANPDDAINIASLLALTVGAIMLFAGIGKLGFIADLLSKPTRIGYMNGLAITIFISQLPKLFGFSVDADGLIAETTAFLQGLANGQALPAATAIGLVSLGLILILSRILPKIPGVLIAVIFAIIASVIFDLASRGVSVVGTLPQGFPPFTIPNLPQASDIPLLLMGAFGIALVALTDTISTATSFAARKKEEVKGNGEMIGIGAANIAASFFQGFPVSTSGSRTAVAEQAGSKTQVTGLISAGIIMLMLVFIPGLMRNLPQPTLAAVVIAASLSLADIKGTKRLLNQHGTEFTISLIAFLGVALFGVLQGILVAIIISIIMVFKRAWWPYNTTLGRAKGISGYHDQNQFPNAQILPGLIIFRFDAALFFANSRAFKENILLLANSRPKPKWIVIAAEPITDVDTTAADMLLDLDEKLNEKGINLVFAEMKNPIKKKLERYELIGPLNPNHFFPTIESAVDAFIKKTNAKWKNPTKKSKSKKKT